MHGQRLCGCVQLSQQHYGGVDFFFSSEDGKPWKPRADPVKPFTPRSHGLYCLQPSLGCFAVLPVSVSPKPKAQNRPTATEPKAGGSLEGLHFRRALKYRKLLGITWHLAWISGPQAWGTIPRAEGSECREATHIAPADERGKIVGEPVAAPGVLLAPGEGTADAHTDAMYVTTTEASSLGKSCSQERWR